MNTNTVSTIAEHARAAQKAYENMPDIFRKYFHLRPTSKDITVVSTLPYAPMRGLNVSPEDLPKRLSAIKKKLPVLLSMTDQSCSELQALGFSKREKQSALEENIQAMFIRGMLDGEDYYQGIRFVASELTLGDHKRFDVVGFQGDTLYIFELKRNRDTTAAPQVKTYCDYVVNHCDKFKEVLGDYPNLSVPHFKSVKGIAVMCYSENTIYPTWNDWYKAAEKVKRSEKYTPDISGIDIWLFKEALTFIKLSSE